MTLKNISAISMVASTLLAGSLFAGTLEIGTGEGTIATELYQNNTELNVSAIGDYNASTPLTYTASFTAPTTVSDPAWEFTFSEAVELNTSASYYMIDSNDVVISSAGTVNDKMLRFTSDATVNIADGGVYRVVASRTAKVLNGTSTVKDADSVTTGSTTAMMSLTQTLAESTSVNLEVYSMSGTPKLSDTATLSLFTVTPEYTVTCANKFDNLINVEDDSLSFVETSHGRNTMSMGQDANQTDIMIFNIARADLDYSVGNNVGAMYVTLDGNASIEFGGSGVFTVTNGTGASGGTVNVNATNNQDFNITAMTGVTAGSNQDFTITYETNGTNPLQEINFTGSFYLDTAKSIIPAGGTSPIGISIGEWNKFGYIAQIGGATANSNIKTKLFITNRGCSSVVPQFTLVYGGQTTTVSAADITGKTSVAADTQVIYTVNEIADVAVAAGFDVGTGALSVEITVPGNAEDIYVYAQSKNQATADGFKDLPVYNTSTRTN